MLITVYVTPKEYSERYRVSESLVREMCRKKILPAMKIGEKLWRIPIQVDTNESPAEAGPRDKDIVHDT